MSIKEKDMVKDILDNNSSLSKEDEKLLKEIRELSEEWDEIKKEKEDKFKPNKEDWEGLPVEKDYSNLSYKEYYKNLLEDSLTKRGYLKNNGDNEEKSYSHKPHLQSLPFDLNTNNLDDLDTRLSEINSRMDKLWDLMHDISADMSDLINKQKNFHKSDEELQNEAFDSIESIHDRYHELFPKGFESKPNVVDLNIGTLNELFEYSGLIDGSQADALMKTAGMLVDYAYEQTDGDDTPWSNKVIGIADDLRALADKHNVNNNSQGKSLEDYTKIQNELNETVKVYRSTRRMYNDFKHEGIRTREKIDSIKKRNRDKKDN